jgi:photosystem II stability/assembly factor-like uncharacterized protein
MLSFYVISFGYIIGLNKSACKSIVYLPKMNVMYRLLFVGVVMCLFFSCKNTARNIITDFTNVEIDVLYKDSLLNVRALELSEQNIVIATSRGETKIQMKGESTFFNIFDNDTINKPNFRALACTSNSIFTISIGNPALLYKDGVLVYKESNENVFYDSIDFWNDLEGIAIGDPTDGCLSVIITRDGGETWIKQSCEIAPKVFNGEAAFAASDTNISIINNATWVATGGKKSNVFFSPDKGITWVSYETPIIQGTSSTGIYSIDFYNKNIGFAIGGDYTEPNANIQNKIRTIDGGKSWSIIANNKAPGYKSCVQFVPNTNGDFLVAVGINGIDYSNDFGLTWKHLSDEGFYTIRFLNSNIAYAAGKERVARLTFN